MLGRWMRCLRANRFTMIEWIGVVGACAGCAAFLGMLVAVSTGLDNPRPPRVLVLTPHFCAGAVIAAWPLFRWHSWHGTLAAPVPAVGWVLLWWTHTATWYSP